MFTISSCTRVSGCTPPESGRRPGSVRSIRSRPRASAVPRSAGVRLDGVGELRESGRIGQRDLGQNLAVEQHAGLLEPGHELRVGKADLTAGRVDAHDPEGPSPTLLLPTIAVRERAGAQDGLGRRPVQLAPAADVALGLLEDLVAPLACLGTALRAWHRSASSLRGTPRAPSIGARPLSRSAGPSGDYGAASAASPPADGSSSPCVA